MKILFMSIGMSAAGAIAWCVVKFLSKVFTKRFLYYMWLVPIILSVVPIVGIQPHIGSDTAQIYDANDYTQPKNYNIAYHSEANAPETTNAANDNQQLPEIVQESIYNRGIDLWQNIRLPNISYSDIAALLYFSIVFILLIKHIIKSARFKIRLKRFAVSCDIEILEKCKKQIGLKRCVSVYSISADCSPFVYGICKPKIVIPNGKITYEALLHELTHIKQNDLLYLLMVNIVKIIHFFNPLIYLYSKRIKKDMELACDEYASSVMNINERLEYGKSILMYSAPPSVGIACLSENGKNIKERIDVIMTKRKLTKTTRVISIILAFVIIVCQTGFAAAINGKIPVKSYMINNAAMIYSVAYKNGAYNYYSGKSGIAENRASLVNTEVYKGFSADLKLEFTNSYAEKENDEDNFDKINADVRVEMDKFIKAIDSGRVWQGLFTVTINNEVVLSEAKGCLNNIPSDDSGISRLYIEKDDISFEIEHINFGIAEDSIINANYNKEQAKNFEADLNRYLYGNVSVTYKYDGNTYTTDMYDESDLNIGLDIHADKESGRLLIDSIPITNYRYIDSIPYEKYIFKDDTVSGKFFIKRNGGIILDEIDGTLSGISGNNITFTSADDSIWVNMNVTAEDDSYYDYRYWVWWEDENGDEKDKDFKDGCIQSSSAKRLSDLPFTLALNKDKTKVILKVNDNFNPQGWYYYYSSYTNTDKDVYNQYHSLYGSRETELEICEVAGSSHNLQFYYYNSNPYVHNSYFDIMFSIVNGELLYRSCREYVIQNTDYSGERGFEMLKEYILTDMFHRFKDLNDIT